MDLETIDFLEYRIDRITRTLDYSQAQDTLYLPECNRMYYELLVLERTLKKVKRIYKKELKKREQEQQSGT